MLTRRQTEIFMDFYANSDRPVKLKTLADKYAVSVRTIQNDIRMINSLYDRSDFVIVSFGSKGSQLLVQDKKNVEAIVEKLSDEYNHSYYFEEQSSRVNYILRYLLFSSKPVKSETLANKMYISKSRISNDLLQVKKILAKYSLSIKSIPYHGLLVIGSEFNRRRCLIKEDLGFGTQTKSNLPEVNYSLLTEIRNLVTPILLEYHFKISDIALQNLIIHISTSINRMQEGYYVEEGDYTLESTFAHAYEISKIIIDQCAQKFNFVPRESEIILLALNLHGKREFDQTQYVSEDINKKILSALTTIRGYYNIDFTNDLDLRIALALHLVPLRSRLTTGLVIKNIMTYKIKISYAFAFDIASAFTKLVFPEYQEKISDDEISYIALHFLVSLNKYNSIHHKKNILLICPDNVTDSLLISQRLKQWFTQINEIRVISEHEIDTVDFEQYNSILTTTEEIAKKYPRARLINYFLTENDFQKIELSLNGFSSVKDILDKFDKDLFFYGHVENKYEIIRILFEKAQKLFHVSDEYYKSVLLHEKYSSTWFGNGLAVPHPEKPIADVSFIATGILDEPIMWDDNCNVQIVFLVSIAKTNYQAYQLWYYMSNLFSSKEALDRIVAEPTYDNLISVINNTYKNLI